MEHRDTLEQKDAQIKELRGSRGKIQLMFALSIKLRQMFQKELKRQQEEKAEVEQALRAGALAEKQSEIQAEMDSYF